ncbi:MAG: MMPL family transporter [Acidobacteriota bacterium]
MLVSAGAAYEALQLRVEADGRRLLDADHTVRRQDDAVAERFALGDPVLLAVIPDDPGDEDWPSQQTLAIAANASAAARRASGLPPERELSLLSLQPASRSSIRFDADALRDSPFLRGTLIGDDTASVASLLSLDRSRPRDSTVRDLIESVDRLDERHGHRVVVTGATVAESLLTEHILDDLAATIPAVVALVGLLLLLGLGSPLATMVALTEVLLSLLCTAGLMAWMGQPIYLPTAMVPVVLVAIGVCDEIYLFNAVRRLATRHPEWTSRRILNGALDHVRTPVIVTSLTTALAFVSFALGEVEAVRAAGIACAVGVLITMTFSLTFTPALWLLLGRWLPRHEGHSLLNPLAAWSPRVGRLAARHRRPILLASGTLAVLALALLPTLQVQDSWISNFSPGSRLRVDTAAVDARFAGTHRILVQLDGAEDGAWHRPDALRRLAALEAALAQPGLVPDDPHDDTDVRATLSAAGFVTEIERLRGHTAAIPDSPSAVRAALGALATPAGDRLAASLVTPDGRHALLHILLRRADYAASVRVVAGIHQEIASLWPDDPPDVTLAGDAIVSQHIVDAVVRHQVLSLVGALAVAWVLAAWFLRSLRLAWIAIAPVTLGALLLLAGMALSGIALGIATSMVVGIGIGVGIDYALHLVSRWSRESGPSAQRLERTFAAVGPAVVANALVVGVGMLALAAADTPPLATLGVLICISLVLGFVLTVCLLPALLARGS